MLFRTPVLYQHCLFSVLDKYQQINYLSLNASKLPVICCTLVLCGIAYESNGVMQNYLQRELDKLIKESVWGSNRADLDPHSTVNTHTDTVHAPTPQLKALPCFQPTVLSLFKQRGNDSFSNGNWRPDPIVSLCPFYLFGSLTFAVTHPGRAWLPNNAVIVYWYLAHSMNTIYFGMPFVFKAGTDRIYMSHKINMHPCREFVYRGPNLNN